MDSKTLHLASHEHTGIQNLFLLAITLIFFPILPGFSETQPILLLGLGGLCLLSGRLSLNTYTVIFFYFFALFIAVLFISNFNNEYLSELSKLLLVLLLVVLAYPWIGYGSQGFYKLFITIHLTIAILATLGWTSWLSSYFGRYTTLEGGRGISYLASEPSYAATYIFYIALVYTLGLNKGVFSSRLTQAILLLLLLSTYSLMGFLFFILVLAIDISLGRVYKKIMMGILTVLGGALFIITVERVTTELIPLITALVSNDEDILKLAINYPSASTRFILNGVAMFDGLERIFGFPEQPFHVALPEILAKYGLGPVLERHEVIGALYKAGVELKPQALFPYVIYMFGALAFPLLLQPTRVTLGVLAARKHLFFMACLALMFIFFFYQSQYVNPVQFFTFIIIHKFFSHTEGTR